MNETKHPRDFEIEAIQMLTTIYNRRSDLLADESFMLMIGGCTREIRQDLFANRILQTHYDLIYEIRNWN